APLLMIQVYTPRHPSCDGGASKLHGHPQSQLHSPRRIRTSATSRPWEDRAVRDWAAHNKRPQAAARHEWVARPDFATDYGSRVVVVAPSPIAAWGPATASAIPARVTRTATPTAPSMRIAATRNGRPSRSNWDR